MSLQDISIKKEYRSLIDDVAKELYIPLLRKAVSYKRAVGFFSSSSLVQITKGIAALALNGGKIQLVASPYLSEEDVQAIRKGYDLRDDIIKKSLLRELKEVLTQNEQDRLSLLAHLIADNILDIKIAFIEDSNNMGMYHEKMGIISDKHGNKVAFSGSMNESATAMTINYEAIDVFCSWRGDAERVEQKERVFLSIWNNTEPRVRIINFPELKREIIDRYKRESPNYEIDKMLQHGSQVVNETPEFLITNKPAIPEGVNLHDYQLSAINEWENSNYSGIFDMATGTGKTFTGLGALVRLSDKLGGKLAVVIVCPYQHLVEQWVEDILKFNIKPVIGYSRSRQRDWRRRLEYAIRDQKLKVRNSDFFCFICTNATFASDFVHEQIGKLNGEALLIVDEAHNFGADNLSKLLTDKFTNRIALSATLERHNDEAGTAKLYSYFGAKCIEYTLERAISEKKLTQYKYYPVLVTLSEYELQKYQELTHEIGKCIIKDKSGKRKLSERGKILALQRARLVAGAVDKLTKLEECIEPYLHERHLLVYCGATKVLNADQDYTSVDEEDIRQIDAVTAILGNKLNMKVSQFTSKEDIEEREILKSEFKKGDSLQALIAIKCLDEGVNIPNIKVAFILASTTNPKEYIQRRGRVLRLCDGKEYAEIYDFITLPRPLDDVASLTLDQIKKELSLVKNELSRAEEFAYLSINRVQAESVLDLIKEAYLFAENTYNFEEEVYEYE